METKERKKETEMVPKPGPVPAPRPPAPAPLSIAWATEVIKRDVSARKATRSGTVEVGETSAAWRRATDSAAHQVICRRVVLNRNVYGKDTSDLTYGVGLTTADAVAIADAVRDASESTDPRDTATILRYVQSRAAMRDCTRRAWQTTARASMGLIDDAPDSDPIHGQDKYVPTLVWMDDRERKAAEPPLGSIVSAGEL
jgi:hypothetical protein